MGLVGYYRQFVKGFAKLAKPLIELTKKNVPFKWSNSYERSFQELKQRLTFVLVLVLLIEGEEYNLYTDVSHQGMRAILMQKGKVIAFAF